MKYPTNQDQQAARGPMRQAAADEGVSFPGSKSRGQEAQPNPFQSLGVSPDRGRSMANGDPGVDPSYRRGPAPADYSGFTTFDERTGQRKGKVCRSCGGVMRKSSRQILSAISGFLLILLGAGLMFLYGMATNFLQVPWFATFALPAGYYVGSLFVGVGVLIFFLRERIWYCPYCGDIVKR